ncbi:MAG: GNAT family N-acetyltransferase [Clostridia bacterium]|nr:GNAT family N-acetyltransferase [Clostridia bacterium]
MLEFYPITIDCIEKLSDILHRSDILSCDFTAGNMFMWGNVYGLKVCILKDFFIVRIGKNGNYSFSFPIGEGDPSEVFQLLLNEYPDSLKLYSLNQKQLVWLNEKYPNRFNFITSDFGIEYVYKAENLAQLPGRKFHQKKNFINRFRNNHSDIYSKVIEESDDLEECRKIAEKWFIDKYNDAYKDEREWHAFELALNHYFELKYKGLLLYADGIPVAFTMGEEINSRIFDTHFEKTLPDYRDAYPVINKEFALHLSEYEYINREDDAGVEALKKAKLSYHPSKFVYKYNADTNSQQKSDKALKVLWKEAFGDDDCIIDSFFENTEGNARRFNVFVDGECASAFYLLECSVRNTSGVFHGYYLYAAATACKFRNQGFMTELIKSAINFSKDKDFLILYPAEAVLHEFYKKIGFVSTVRAYNGDNLLQIYDMTAEDYCRYVDEKGFVCYSKKVYRYYKTYAKKNESLFVNGNGLAIIYNDLLSESDLIIKDIL